MMVMRANSPKPGKSKRQYTVTRVETRSSYGNALYLRSIQFVEFGNAW